MASLQEALAGPTETRDAVIGPPCPLPPLGEDCSYTGLGSRWFGLANGGSPLTPFIIVLGANRRPSG